MASQALREQNVAETTTQIVREAEPIEQQRMALLLGARELVEKQKLGEMLPAYQVAGFAPAQLEAMRAAEAQGIGAYQPYVTAANQALSQGYGLTGQAAQTLTGADTRQQFLDAQRAMQAAGIGATGITAGVPQIQQGMQAVGMGQQAALGGMGMYDPNMAQGFMNPYQQAVTQQALGEMRRQADIARQGQAAQAVRAGAFGGTREGVQRAEMERGLQDVMAQRVLQDYAQNYGQAQQAAMTASEQARQRQLATGQLMGQLGTQYGNLAAQQGSLYGQQAAQLQNLGQGIGALAGQQFGIGQSIAGGLGALGSQMGQLGIQQGALGQTAQALQQGDVNFLYNIGQSQQALNQQAIDAQRATQLQQLYAPYQQYGFLSDIQRGAPSSQMVTSASAAPQPSPFQQVTGTVLGAAAAGKAVSKLF
jgi:hypothetical protein